MGKTFRRGGSERGNYSFGKSIRDKRQRGQIVQQLKETIMNPKGKKDPKSQSSTMKMVGNDWEDDDDIYVDIEFDDSSEIDYGLEYTQSN